MKRTLAVLAVLMICFQFVPFASAQSGEWTCPDCGKVNSGLFCGSCGRPKETPSPTPSPAPTPSPTPVPETWQCRYCEGTNPWEDAYCNYCGTKKSASEGKRFENPVAPLYRGMTKEEVKAACGGEPIYKFYYHGYQTYVEYDYSDGKLIKIELNVTLSDISFVNFFRLVMADFGYDGWSEIAYIDGNQGPYSMKSTEDMDMIVLGTVSNNVLIIFPTIQWDNVKAGRELVKQE